MIVLGVLVLPEHCAAVGEALQAAQDELRRRNGAASPLVAAYVEQCRRVARSRRAVDAADAALAPSQAHGSSPSVGSREAASRSGWSLRSVQGLAARGSLGRKVGRVYVFTEAEVDQLARSRGKGRGDRPRAA